MKMYQHTVLFLKFILIAFLVDRKLFKMFNEFSMFLLDFDLDFGADCSYYIVEIELCMD